VANPPTRTWILAGGLTPENVQGLIAELRPWGVDVSSGVESSRGVKSPELIRSFVHAARTARAV
jgi:phosphoribosylanthranilate isomerase